MTYYGGKELAEAFRTVRNNTIQIAEDIPESKYDFKPSPDTSSIGETLKHLAVSTGFQGDLHSKKVTDMKTLNFMEIFEGFKVEQAKMKTKADIIATLKSKGDAFAAFLEGLPESFLAEQVTMPPGRDTGDQEPLRDAAVGQGARDAPPRPADDDGADERHRAAHHPCGAGAPGPHDGRSANR